MTPRYSISVHSKSHFSGLRKEFVFLERLQHSLVDGLVFLQILGEDKDIIQVDDDFSFVD
jgi:hypothetical protein